MLTLSGLESGKILAVGVSGGADSLALLHFLHGLNYPLLVCHFNHRLRPEADSDQAFVRDFAAKLGLPFETDSADVAAHAAAAGLSVEEAARELRYRFLFRAARKAGAQAVATGHTADDQAETVLMHFLRGAGLSGLKGMTPRVLLPAFDAEIPLVRPLLSWARADTENYCREHEIAYLIDASNADTAYFRNRLRHELLPELKKYNPQIRQTLAKTALALQGDYELLSDLVDSAWTKTVTATGSGFIAFERTQLEGLSPALRRNLFRKAAFTLKPGIRDVDFEALERAAALKPVDIGAGLKTLLEGTTLYLAKNGSALPNADWPQITAQIEIVPGQMELGNGWQLDFELLGIEHWQKTPDPWSAWLDADLTESRLRIRAFRSGDRFEQLGMRGQTVKLTDLFVNLKIPKRLRPKWPVVCVDDEIAWVTGLRLGHKFRVTEMTQRVVKLQIKRLP